MPAAGGCHTVLLRSDGAAVAFGRAFEGQCRILYLIHISEPTSQEAIWEGRVLVRKKGGGGGGYHTVLLRSDGVAGASGLDDDGQCRIPALEAGVSYTQVAAGGCHTVLLRSDGAAVAFGLDNYGHCTMTQMPGGGS